MTSARQRHVNLDVTPYYLCSAYCTRGAVLAGLDPLTGRQCDDRWQWISDELPKLNTVFAINVYSYAVQQDYFELFLHVDRERSRTWSNKEVIQRWCQLFASKKIVDRYSQGEKLNSNERNEALETIAEWRTRLADFSWLMRWLSELIARRANKQDQRKGRFWQGRFSSKALLDEGALLLSLVHTDLQPSSPGSDPATARLSHTSWRLRQQGVKSSDENSPLLALYASAEGQAAAEIALPLTEQDYHALSTWTEQALLTDGHAELPDALAEILRKCHLNPDYWLAAIANFDDYFHRIIGSPERILSFGSGLAPVSTTTRRRRALSGYKISQSVYLDHE